ncbi:protein phosphatase 2C domain-containing protein [Streptodolium elevatio]|uniref:Protein phosphatase 2C domain-containing protein n=1 Tax=Streptodolium elevatio TaxID=3157996 RepID=A0ABV3DBD2_9ACTN
MDRPGAPQADSDRGNGRGDSADVSRPAHRTPDEHAARAAPFGDRRAGDADPAPSAPRAAAAADPGPGAGDDMFADLYLDFDDMADLPPTPSRPVPPPPAHSAPPRRPPGGDAPSPHVDPAAPAPGPAAAPAPASTPGPTPAAGPRGRSVVEPARPAPRQPAPRRSSSAGQAGPAEGARPSAQASAPAYDPTPRPGARASAVGGSQADPYGAAGHDATVPSIRALPTDTPAVPPPPVPPPPGPIPPAEADEATSRTDSVARRRDQDARPTAGDVEVQASAWSAASHPGRRRAMRRERLGLGPELTARDNDDRYAATGSVFVVADGLGGHPSGWYAADVACRTLVADLAAADLSAGWSDRLRASIAVADLAVRRHGHGQTYEGMRTTVVAAVIQDGRLHLAGCGDSVCWLVRGGAAFRLTEQGNAADLGRPWLLTSTPLGGSQQPDPELQRIELHPGDRVVLATDGVGHLPDETVADLIHGDPFHAATTLTVTAVQSGDDDATAVVIECEALPTASTAAAPPRARPAESGAEGPGQGPEDSPASG